MLRAIIVDDEPLARAVVREHLVEDPEITVAAECGNGFEAVKAVTELRPDLLFLDVQMPKLNGFEVLELVEGTFAVVFVTAHDEHAVRAFEVNAVDYLLKPFSRERFDRALSRAKASLERRSAPDPRTLSAALSPRSGPTDRILVRDGSKVHIVDVDRVDYVTAEDDYVAIHAGGKRHLKQQPLAVLEGQLDAGRFVRIHRSTILNIRRLSRIELYAKDSRVAILQDGTRLPISRAGYDKLKALLDA